MATRRALAAAAGCCQCRSTVLNVFLNHSVSLTSLARSSSSASNSFQSSETHEPLDSARNSGEQELSAEAEATVIDTSEASSSSEVPWYLQVEPPSRAPDMQPPPLPTVPEDAPATITSILEYASEEMGLDDISLLDLRGLEPPAALGPKLFMIFGTARSQRHLNVSAGRLVRWLRYKHRIVADADGLLGPNERKTKLRRKARRAKLLGTMGTDDADDGISTGWICVHLGTLNRDTKEATIVNEDGRFAGFGITNEGYTVVFQVMTEARRAEMKLETLWQRLLERSQQKVVDQTQGPERSEEAWEDADVVEEVQIGGKSTPITQSVSTQSVSTSPKNDLQPLEKAVLSSSDARPSLDAQSPRPVGSRTPGQTRSMSSQSASETPYRPSSHDAESISAALLTDGQKKLQVLHMLQRSLKESTASSTERQLDAPAIHKLFRLAVNDLPVETSWSHCLELAYRAGQVQSSGTAQAHLTLDVAKGLVKQLRLSTIIPSRDQWTKLISCIYYAQDAPIQDRTTVALEVLESMQVRAERVIAYDVLVAIIEAVSTKSHDDEALAVQTRIEELIPQADLPYMGEALLLRLMTVYARQQEWKKFWDCWRTPPRHFKRRSEQFYIGTLALAAADQGPLRQRVNIRALRQCFHEMTIESPPVVPIGRVRKSIMDCIRVADPKAEDLAGKLNQSTMLATERRECVKIIRRLQMIS
jgi:hypothetical protein